MLIFYTALIDDESEKLRFEEIYYSYHKRMYVVAKKILSNNEDAEDAVQTSLLNLARHMDRVPTGNEQVLNAYIFTTVRNTALSMLRKRSREIDTISMDDLPISIGGDPLEAMMKQNDYDMLLAVISELPLSYREIVFLRYVQGKDVKEVAEIIGRTSNYVRVQTHRAKKQLADLCREVGMRFE